MALSPLLPPKPSNLFDVPVSDCPYRMLNPVDTAQRLVLTTVRMAVPLDQPWDMFD